ncbi:unnamed protein product [Kuraishia capsulata CBS 1993]|uniref:JAB1/MPN/MOV34 metalloenzyme domain-containing protein n=1 Tax=Kuraishia capsulata CBS 1993 TaxID=1382522 RepID=W6MFK2_9ASCO|nr:uncharacterized protein KUCA_T00000088001 [Kuraishia capsulata CBS 1993]CDK24128.1 unnamed protein product [Kuraishia capsulata CBS 1993]
MSTVIHPLVLFTIGETLTRRIDSNVGVLLARSGSKSCAVVASFPLVLSGDFQLSKFDGLLKDFSVVYPASQFYGFYYITSADATSETVIKTQIAELYNGANIYLADDSKRPVMRFDRNVFENDGQNENGSEIPFVNLYDLVSNDPIEYSMRSFASEKIAIDGISHHLKDSTADAKSSESTLAKLDTAVADMEAFLATMRGNIEDTLQYLYKVQLGETRKDDSFLIQLETILDKIDRLSREDHDIPRTNSRLVQKLKDEISLNLSLVLTQVELVERQI